MMSLMRRRAEAARHKRIDHVFMKADDNLSGKITINQMIRCFALNGEVVDAALEKEIQKLADKDGTISKQVFMKYALNTHLCKEDPQELKEQFEKKSEKKYAGEYNGASNSFRRKSLAARRATLTATTNKEHQYLKTPIMPGQPVDKVTILFEKFDVDKDGYLSRQEFDVLMKDVRKDQADRIFNFSTSERIGGDGKRISASEFRKMLNVTKRWIEK